MSAAEAALERHEQRQVDERSAVCCKAGHTNGEHLALVRFWHVRCRRCLASPFASVTIGRHCAACVVPGWIGDLITDRREQPMFRRVRATCPDCVGLLDLVRLRLGRARRLEEAPWR